MARFQFKMIRQFSGNSNDPINPSLLPLFLQFCSRFCVWYPKGWRLPSDHVCTAITEAKAGHLSCGEDLGWNDLANSEHNWQPQQHKPQPIVGVGGSGGGCNAAALQRLKHTHTSSVIFNAVIHSMNSCFVLFFTVCYIFNVLKLSLHHVLHFFPLPNSKVVL